MPAAILRFPVPSHQPAEGGAAARLVDLVPRYEQSLYALDRSPASIEHYVRTLQRFIVWLGDEPTLDALTWETVLDYRDEMGGRRLSGSTIVNTLSVISSFADWAVERRLLRENPAASVARPQRGDTDPHPLTPEQVKILFEAIKEPPDLSGDAAWLWRRNRRLVYLMIFAGFRRSEACAVRWSHVLLDVEIIHLQEGTKGRKPRRVGIHPDLLDELLTVPAYARQPDHAVAGLPTGGTITRSAIEHIFERWLRRDLKIDQRLGTHLHPHKLRTTFATYFIWSGGSTLTLQKLMGHADVNTTQHYVLTDDEQKRQEIRKLQFTRS